MLLGGIKLVHMGIIISPRNQMVHSLLNSSSVFLLDGPTMILTQGLLPAD